MVTDIEKLRAYRRFVRHAITANARICKHCKAYYPRGTLSGECVVCFRGAGLVRPTEANILKIFGGKK
mgnify:CR=1 FL=1